MHCLICLKWKLLTSFCRGEFYFTHSNKQVPGGNPDERMGVDTNTEQHASPATAVDTDAAVASSVGLASNADALSQSEGLPEGPALSGHDPDSFSDSYSHIAPSSDEPSATQLNIETLGGAELTQEEQRLSQEGSVHHLNEEKLTHEGAQSDIEKTSDVGKPAGMNITVFSC